MWMEYQKGVVSVTHGDWTKAELSNWVTDRDEMVGFISGNPWKI